MPLYAWIAIAIVALGALAAWALCRVNRACVNPSHLFLGTPQDNMADMVAKGRAAGLRRRGEANPGAKLSVAKVAWIRAASNLGVPQRRIAKSVGVSQPTVSAVVTGARWA